MWGQCNKKGAVTKYLTHLHCWGPLCVFWQWLVREPTYIMTVKMDKIVTWKTAIQMMHRGHWTNMCVYANVQWDSRYQLYVQQELEVLWVIKHHLFIISMGLSLMSYLYDGHSSLHHCCPSSHFLHHRPNSHECKKWYGCRQSLGVKAVAPNNFVVLESMYRHTDILYMLGATLRLKQYCEFKLRPATGREILFKHSQLTFYMRAVW